MDANQQDPVVNAGEEENKELSRFLIFLSMTLLSLLLGYNYQDSYIFSTAFHKLSGMFTFSMLMIIGKWITQPFFPAWGTWFDYLGEPPAVFFLGDALRIAFVSVAGLQK
uniref:ADP,ATP carrier protein n=1 Tax=Steinernema glaseri TaxID=37863 RepID=A0A1I7ZCP2_9BILA